MPNFDLILPWVACGLTLWAFFALRGWIQRHLFGMGWLVAQEQHLATVIYCIVLLPGIFVHEVSHWVLAGVFNVRTHRITTWPKADAQGRIDLSFIKVKDSNNPVFLILIGVAPFVIGFALILFISGKILHLSDFIVAINTGNLQVIGLALQNLIGQPDFLLWFYLLFTLSNTVWPEKEDRRGWVIIALAVVGVVILLAVIGFDKAVVRWFSGPIPQGLNSLTTIFLTMLAIDGVFAIVLWLLERSTERVTHRYAPYHQATALVASKDSKIANAPRLSSILQYQLPLPPPPRKVERPAVGAASAESQPKPALGSAASGTRPALSPSKAPDRPAESPKPGTPSPTPASRPLSSPTGSPAFGTSGSRPGITAPAASSTPPGQPANQPGAPRPTPTPGAPSGVPFGSRPALPASTGSSGSALTPVSSPAPRPPVGNSGPSPTSGAPRSGVFGAASPNRAEDYIDAEVIEENVPPTTPPATNQPPSVTNAPKAVSMNEPLFIDPEESGD